MGFLVKTLIFAVMGIIAALLVYFSISVFTNLLQLILVTTAAAVGSWMMWAIVYIAQMNPLIVPILNEGE